MHQVSQMLVQDSQIPAVQTPQVPIQNSLFHLQNAQNTQNADPPGPAAVPTSVQNWRSSVGESLFKFGKVDSPSGNPFTDELDCLSYIPASERWQAHMQLLGFVPTPHEKLSCSHCSEKFTGVNLYLNHLDRSSVKHENSVRTQNVHLRRSGSSSAGSFESTSEMAT